MTKVIAVAGYKNSGKTFLAGSLIRALAKKGLKTAYIKHSHEKVISSGEFTDTGRQIFEGIPSFLAGQDGLIMEVPGFTFSEEGLEWFFFREFDLLLVEGGKELKIPKIWTGCPAENDNYPGIIAFYNCPSGVEGRNVFRKGEEERLTEFVFEYFQKTQTGIEIYSRGKPVRIKQFVADFIIGGITGMLGSLKGIADLDDISINIRHIKGKKTIVDVES